MVKNNRTNASRILLQLLDRKLATLLAVCTATFLVPLDITVIAVALPDIERTLNASFNQLQWIVNGYNLTFTAFLLPSGALADLFGRRLIFILGLVIFTLTSLFCSLADSPLVLAFSRGVQGFGGALVLISAMAILAQEFQGRERTKAFGIWGAIIGVGTAFGPMVGGMAVHWLGWQWIFLLNFPIGISIIAITLTKVRKSHAPQTNRVDWAGVITFTAALFLLFFAVIQGNEKGWGSFLIISLLVGTAVLVVVFVIIELVQPCPMFDLFLFRKPTFIGASILSVANGASFWAMIIYLPLYFQNILNYSPLQAGLALLPLTVPLLVGPPIGSKLSVVLPVRVLLSTGMILIGLGFIWMHGIDANSNWTTLLPGCLVAGIGAGLINAEIANVAITVVPSERSGMASGITTTFRHGSFAVGISVLGAILAYRIKTKLIDLIANMPTATNGRISQLADMITAGNMSGAIKSLSPETQSAFAQAAKDSFISGLNLILLAAAVIAISGAVLTFALVRDRDIAGSCNKS
jgi:EmrB/QacA subfamily drug resistance transporter